MKEMESKCSGLMLEVFNRKSKEPRVRQCAKRSRAKKQKNMHMFRIL